MKKCTLALVLAAVLPFAANGYEYDAGNYYTTRPSAKPATTKTVTTSRKTGGYKNTIQNNFYYNQPTARTNSYSSTQRQARSARYQPEYYDNTDRRVTVVDDSYEERSYKRTTKTSQIRKYFLAHPFFQPLKGRFGSVTDLSYGKSDFKLDILNGAVTEVDTVTDPLNPTIVGTTPVTAVDLSGKSETTQLLVKEDFSFGLSDTLAIIGMAQYDKTKVTFKDWSDNSASNSLSDSGLNLFGIGLQSRFVDNNEWIAMASGYYQHQKDTANIFLGELKVGYKIDRTTVYGLGRVWYTNLTDGDMYGAYVEENNDWLMLTYKTDVKDIVYAEGGLGIFSVLSKDFTLNGEVIYGYYDWHNQLNVKGAIGWQPGDSFALNLYASTSLYDSAKDQTKKYLEYQTSSTGYYLTEGQYKIKDYNEWKIGAQVIFYF